MSNGNTETWDLLSKTPPEVTSKYVTSDGTELTAVDPIYRARKLTEVFGPAGIGWGWEVLKEWREEFGAGSFVFAKVQVWYCDLREGDHIRYVGPQIGGSPPLDPSDCYKAAITDAIGKCFSMLGLAADVYSGAHSPTPAASTNTKLADTLARAVKLHAEGNKEAIDNARQAIQRSKIYTDSEKTAVIQALSTGAAKTDAA